MGGSDWTGVEGIEVTSLAKSVLLRVISGLGSLRTCQEQGLEEAFHLLGAGEDRGEGVCSQPQLPIEGCSIASRLGGGSKLPGQAYADSSTAGGNSPLAPLVGA